VSVNCNMFVSFGSGEMDVKNKILTTLWVALLTCLTVILLGPRSTGFTGVIRDFFFYAFSILGGASTLLFILMIGRMLRRHYIEQIWVAYRFFHSLVIMVCALVIYELVITRYPFVVLLLDSSTNPFF